MRTIALCCGMGLASLAFGLAGGLLTLPVGLILDDRLTWGLVLAVAALFAALGSTWAGSLLARSEDAPQLAAVVTVSEIVAGILWLVRLSPRGSMLARALETNLVYLSGCVVMLAFAAVVAAARFRAGRSDLRRLVSATLRLVGATIVGVPAVVYVASLFGLVGA